MREKMILKKLELEKEKEARWRDARINNELEKVQQEEAKDKKGGKKSKKGQ